MIRIRIAPQPVADSSELSFKPRCYSAPVESHLSHLMGDSADYAEEAVPEAHECVCENEVFELMSGVSVYEGTHDVRRYYIACHCVECNLVGVFADWKCEAGDAAAFLAKV